MSLHMGAAGSVADGKAMAVYLLEQQIPMETMRAAAYYGQTPGGEDAITAGFGAAPLLRADIDPVLADTLGLTPGQAISPDALAHILSGQRADGAALPGQPQHHRTVLTYHALVFRVAETAVSVTGQEVERLFRRVGWRNATLMALAGLALVAGGYLWGQWNRPGFLARIEALNDVARIERYCTQNTFTQDGRPACRLPAVWVQGSPQ